MKKLLASALACCALLCTGLLSPPAKAASLIGQEHFTDGDYTFAKVEDIGAYAPLNDHFNRGDDVYFTDGFLLMRSSDMAYQYLGTDGKLHDLNQGRFDYVYPFADGLAAVVKDNKVGYMDTAGKLVIPCQFDAPMNTMGSPCAGFFADGKAWVFRYREGTDVFKVSFEGNAFGGWAQIDKTGKLLTEYSADANLGEMGIKNELYKQYDLFCPNDTAMGFVGFDEACTAPGLGNFMARFGTSDTGLVQLPTGGKDANGQPVSLLYVVQRKTVARTRYKSTAELTRAYVEELDFSNFVVTITNPTGSYDSGTIALVLASGMGTINFVDYELAPKESKEYNLTVPGHIGVKTNDKIMLLGKGWGAYLNADVITFKSDEDRDAYRSAVVYEKNSDHFVDQGTGTGMGINSYRVVCNGQPGDEWLKSYTGIQRHHQLYQDPTKNHNTCKK